ncbi:MAG TPA: M23 family metallopeptidase [Candidatus Bathyarchaeia archaeon]|nr:M23 family metallopeptidase [Candidatus Bathyarchaeia archaeon]
MKKILIALIIIFFIAGAVFLWSKDNLKKSNLPILVDSGPNIPAASLNPKASENPPAAPPAPSDQKAAANQNSSGFQPPLDRADERVTKKPFGIFITPQTSPVQPERFRGYHTGTDFEIFPEELNMDVPVHAICTGKILSRKYASGYGGVLVESCTLDNQPITVIYGHLKLASIMKKSGDNLSAGDEIGDLGKAYSFETSGERKHLHLGIHKGPSNNILGYVQSQSQLSGWIDACSLVCK